LTANWDDAEDALQDVFMTLASKAGTIRRGEALAAWIYRATVNRALDRRRRRGELSLDSESPRVARVIGVESLRMEARREAALRRDALLSRIEAFVPALPPRQSAVFVLRGFQGLSHREIAEALGCTEAGAKSSYSLACRKLRQWIQAEEQAARTRGEA
jgi:RNA polymerase sigma factor (sigma-70 family)